MSYELREAAKGLGYLCLMFGLFVVERAMNVVEKGHYSISFLPKVENVERISASQLEKIGSEIMIR